MATATCFIVQRASYARVNRILRTESVFERVLAFFFPPAPLGRVDATSLGYHYRMSRTGVERNLVEINMYVKLGGVTVGEAKPTYDLGTAARRAALIRGEI